MQKQLVINLLLLTLVIALGLFMFNTEKEESKPIEYIISDIEASSINHIEIERLASNNIAFEKSNNQWLLIDPINAPAHPNRIESILNVLTTTSSNQLNADGLDLTQLGLDKPEATLILNDSRFEFGKTNPLDKTRYLRNGDFIYTINDQLFYQLTTGENFFINPKVINNPADIIKIVTDAYELTKTDDTWKINLFDNTIETTANVILNGWQQLEGNPVKPKEIEDTLGTVEVTYKDESTLSLDIAATEPELVLVNNDLKLEYKIIQYMADIIFPKPKVELEK